MNPLTAIVLNWNGSEDTLACVAELRKPVSSAWPRVVVVDNASSVDQLRKLRSSTLDFELVPLQENLGFSGGINEGLRFVLGASDVTDDDVVAIVNNDARIDASSLGRLGEVVRTRRDLGLVAPLILRGDGEVWYGGGQVSSALGLVRVRRDEPRGQLNETGFVTLALAVARIGVIREVGLLDERFFFGEEEWDYSIRVRRARYGLAIDSSVRSSHDGDGSHENHHPAFIYNSYRNKFMFHRKWNWQAWHVPWLLVTMIRILVSSTHIARRQRGELRGGQVAHAACLAFRDHFLRGQRVSRSDIEDAGDRLQAPISLS